MSRQSQIKSKAVEGLHPDDKNLEDPNWDAVGLYFSSLIGFARIGSATDLDETTDPHLEQLVLVDAYPFSVGDEDEISDAAGRMRASLRWHREQRTHEELMDERAISQGSTRPQIIRHFDKGPNSAKYATLEHLTISTELARLAKSGD